MDHENWLGDGSSIHEDSEGTTVGSETADPNEFTGSDMTKTSTKSSNTLHKEAGSVLRDVTNRRTTNESNTSGIIDDFSPYKDPKPPNQPQSSPKAKRSSKEPDSSKNLAEEAEEVDESFGSKDSSGTSGGETLPPFSPKPQNRVPKTVKKSKASENKNKRKQTNPKKLKAKNVLAEIIKLQGSTDVLIPKLNFSRVVREVMQEVSGNKVFRVTPECLMALQESSELYLTHFFSDAYLCTVHRGRVTMIPKDMQLALRLRGINDPGV